MPGQFPGQPERFKVTVQLTAEYVPDSAGGSWPYPEQPAPYSVNAIAEMFEHWAATGAVRRRTTRVATRKDMCDSQGPSSPAARLSDAPAGAGSPCEPPRLPV